MLGWMLETASACLSGLPPSLCCFHSWSASPPRLTEVPPAMLDKPCSLCTPPAQADGSPGGVPMAGARTRPCAGRAALSRPMRATCSPWGQRAGRGPRTRGGAAPQRPWSDFYRQGGKRCWEGRRRVTVRGAGGPRSPAVTSGCADKPQPRLLAATTRSHV